MSFWGEKKGKQKFHSPEFFWKGGGAREAAQIQKGVNFLGEISPMIVSFTM